MALFNPNILVIAGGKPVSLHQKLSWDKLLSPPLIGIRAEMAQSQYYSIETQTAKNVLTRDRTVFFWYSDMYVDRECVE